MKRRHCYARECAFMFSVIMALSLLSAGCESRDWQRARRQNTVEAYRQFIEKYPDSVNVEKAYEMIDNLDFQSAEEARTLSAFQEYARLHPQGAHLERARAYIRHFIRQRVDKLSVEDMEDARATVKTGMGDFVIRLYPDVAPAHCRNLIYLALSDFYDGLQINWIKPESIVKMGDPRGDSLGGPGYMIEAEINDRPHLRGTVSMWRHPVDINTAGSQFMVLIADMPEFDGQYTVFGEVVEGIETLDAISRVPLLDGIRPRSPVIIEDVTVSGLPAQD